MGTRKITAIMLAVAMLVGMFTANAQEKTNKWEPTLGFGVKFGLFSANKGWKDAMGARPGGFSGGFVGSFGLKYGKMSLLMEGDYTVTAGYNSGNSSENCTLTYGLFEVKLGYDFWGYKKHGIDYGLTFLTGFSIGAGNLSYEFESEFTAITLQQAKDLSVTFRQNAVYVPLEIRWRYGVGYVGIAYMLNVSRGDVTSGHNAKAKITDAPNINILPLQLSMGLQL